MKIKTLFKLAALVGLLAWALPARAGKFSDLLVSPSSGTYFIGYDGGSVTPARGKDAVLISSGAMVVQSTSSTVEHKPLRVKNEAGTDVASVRRDGAITSASSVTANSALIGNGANVSTFSPAGALTLAPNAALTLSGASGNVVAAASMTASAFFGDGSHLSGLVSAVATYPTHQVLTSGSGTYSTPANARYLRVRFCGAGGGGGQSTSAGGGNDNAGNGGTTTFNVTAATGGVMGSKYGNTISPGGAGGTGGAGASGVWASSAAFRAPGNAGGAGNAVGDTVGGAGGGSAFFGGGAKPNIDGDTAGIAAVANSGGGGSGGCQSNGACGGSGGGGECVELTINAPAASYPYVVGAGGLAGAGTSAGGSGGSGMIVVNEFYNY